MNKYYPLSNFVLDAEYTDLSNFALDAVYVTNVSELNFGTVFLHSINLLLNV